MTVRVTVLFLLTFAAGCATAQDRHVFFMADRLEYVRNEDAWLWDLQGWYGSDEHKLWWKTEGVFDGDDAEEAEIQLLYSRAVSAFWDLQLGLRYDVEPEPSGTHAVIGLQGLAPQWFEVDLAALVHEDGDVSLRFEAEYDLLLTQALVLQPRLALDSDTETTSLGLRLRYEIRREIAPYIGVRWQDATGGADGASFVIGARFWF